MSQDQDFSAGARQSTLLGAGHGAPESHPHLSLKPRGSEGPWNCNHPVRPQEGHLRAQLPGQAQPTPAEQNSPGLRLRGHLAQGSSLGRLAGEKRGWESGAGRRFKGVKVEMGSTHRPREGQTVHMDGPHSGSSELPAPDRTQGRDQGAQASPALSNVHRQAASAHQSQTRVPPSGCRGEQSLDWSHLPGTQTPE